MDNHIRNSQTISFGTLNVRGLHNNNKRKNVFKWLQETDLDIIFLQETFCTKQFKPYFNSGWKGQKFHALSDSPHSRGVCILIKHDFNFKFVNKHTSADGRKLLVNGRISDEDVTLICTYAPNQEAQRMDFFNALVPWINKHSLSLENQIIAGDMNCCLNENDRKPKTHTADKSRLSMSKMIQALCLDDAWTLLNPNTPGYTYLDKRNGTLSRLDYFLINHHQKLKANMCKLTTCPFVPDHSAVILISQREHNIRGPGYWKMNNNIIKDELFINELKLTIYKTLSQFEELPKQIIWEILKVQIKQLTIKHSVKKSRERQTLKNHLQSRLDNIINKLNNNDIEKDEFVKTKSDIENSLDKIYSYENDGAKLRSKVNWIENGEKPSRYFLSLEKGRQSNSVIRELNVNESLVKTDQEILTACASFYKDLYTSQNIDITEIERYLNTIKIPKINEHERILCDNPFSEEEYHTAIRNLKQNKSPGLDGISPEFYKMHWNIIKNPFIDMVNETFEKGSLPSSLTKSVVTLIFKKGDSAALKNYRPISLTNYDYKIIAFILARRIQSVIKHIVHTDQSGYIKHRYIGMNARIIKDIFEFCEENEKPGSLICLDFEKAFDRLEWNFMVNVLKHFNFGNKFIKWIQILYTNPSMVIKNNGWISNQICMSRGIRQGCPVSALLFILSVEVMAISIRSNEEISGFIFNNFTHKLTQYADDTTLLLSNIDSISKAIKTINQFCKVSGSRLNINKTEGIWLGPYKLLNIEKHHGVTFTNEPVRCLGLYIGHDEQGCETKNWVNKIQKLQTTIQRWQSRKLTLYGKILIIKTVAISQLIFNLTVLTIPTKYITQINKIIYNFIWNKTDRIKRKTLINTIENGGLNMIDLESKYKALKASWIPKLLSNEKHCAVLNFYLKRKGICLKTVIDGGIKHSNVLKALTGITDFYAECVTCFNSCNSYYDTTSYSYLAQPIWCNTNITFKDKPVLFRNWTNNKILWLKDILGKDGTSLLRYI